jgi:hypothetical protein
LDWTEREHSDHLFGELRGKSRWRKLEEIGGDDAEFLATGWLDEVKETGLVESYVVSDESGWTARQVRAQFTIFYTPSPPQKKKTKKNPTLNPRDKDNWRTFRPRKAAGLLANLLPAQIWGFEEFDEKRYYTRHVVVKKDEEVKKAKLVYDYIKPLDEEVDEEVDDEVDGEEYEE